MSLTEDCDIVVVGGGAAGFFAAIRARSLAPRARVVLLEAAARTLQKVKISGGGRCNVTHACFEVSQLLTHYPRGHKELRPILSRFGPRDTMRWFEDRGVALKIEADGRVFPVSDSSQSIIDCLEGAARKAGVEVCTHCPVQTLEKKNAHYLLATKGPVHWHSPTVLLATGSNPAPQGWLEKLGHQLVPHVPSLFTFNLQEKRFTELAGISLPLVKATLMVKPQLVSEGPFLFTHWGVSGPAILKLSAWAARPLAELNYQAELRLDLLPQFNQEEIREVLFQCKQRQPQRQFSGDPPLPLPKRLWRALTEESAGLAWREVADKVLNRLSETCKRLTLRITGRSVFKEEFVVAGGVPLKEIDVQTMESRRSPGIFLAGEALDVDGVTGGFNFQNAWAGGWVAGEAMAQRCR